MSQISRNVTGIILITSKLGTDNGTELNRLTDQRDSKIKENALFSVALMYDMK